MRYLFTFLMLCSFAKASDVYFAQAAAGGATGANCANAESLATFNAGSATAGNTYHACGTLTAQISLPACTSGSSGSKCTLLFESGANLTMAALPSTGGITLNGNPFWVLNGGSACGTTPGQPVTSWLTACATNQTGTGIIQSTNNGTTPNFANQVASIGINISGTHDSEIKNFLILNVYQKVLARGSDLSSGAQDSYGICGGTSTCGAAIGSNVSIHDLYTSYTAGGIFIGAGAIDNTRVFNVVNRHYKWGIVYGQSTNPIATSTNLLIYDNDQLMTTDWDTDQANGNPYHKDSTFVFGQDATHNISGIYIYNNYLTQVGYTSGYCPTALLYANQNLANMYIFNNVFTLTNGYTCNGMVAVGYSTTSQTIANNTFVGYTAATCFSTTSSACVAIGDAGADAAASTTIYNNTVSALSSNLYFPHSGAAGFVAVDNNAYNGWDLHGGGPWNNGVEFDTLVSWQGQTCGGANCDTHNVAAAPNLSASFVPNSGSPLISAGKNLFSTCNGQPNPGLGAMCFDAAGIARPNASWDIGARQFTSPAASAPTFSLPSSPPVYSQIQTVTISCSTGPVACYNFTGAPATDGATSCSVGTKYSGAILIGSTKTLYAVCGGTGFSDSSVTTGIYNLILSAPTGGIFAGNLSETGTMGLQ